MSKEYAVLKGFRVVREYLFAEGAEKGKPSAITIQGPRPQAIVPYSLIGPGSEAWRQGDRGDIEVERWKAEELGLVPAGHPIKKPLPMKGERAAVAISAVLEIIRDTSLAIRATGAPLGSDSICECGVESSEHDSDPIGWHRTEFAAGELDRLAARIESACDDG